MDVWVSIVRFDPMIPWFYAQREINGLERKSAGLDRKGKTKKAMSKSQKQKRKWMAAKAKVEATAALSLLSLLSRSSLPSSFSPPLVLSPISTLTTSNNLSSLGPPAKKRRLSADKALALSFRLQEESENIEVKGTSIDDGNIRRARRRKRFAWGLGLCPQLTLEVGSPIFKFPPADGLQIHFAFCKY
ncbi:hypothetical protein BDZ97DRAFT_1760083 [Flammula alnicola]|nr:hypothetical protein BDZ97DRAFT_1760083 [Flammula alnicola]